MVVDEESKVICRRQTRRAGDMMADARIPRLAQGGALRTSEFSQHLIPRLFETHTLISTLRSDAMLRWSSMRVELRPKG